MHRFSLHVLALLSASCDSTPPAFFCCGDSFGETAYLDAQHDEPPRADELRVAQQLLLTPGMPPDATDVEVALALRDHARSWPFWQRARDVAPTVQYVRQRALELDVSPVPLGAAYLEARLAPNATSPECRRGVWQLLPTHPGVRLEGCRVQDSPTWTPEDPTTVQGRCVLLGCDVDDRDDLALATGAGLRAGELFGHSPSRVAAVYGLLTCATDSPPPFCEHVSVREPEPRRCIE